MSTLLCGRTSPPDSSGGRRPGGQTDLRRVGWRQEGRTVTGYAPAITSARARPSFPRRLPANHVHISPELAERLALGLGEPGQFGLVADAGQVGLGFSPVGEGLDDRAAL